MPMKGRLPNYSRTAASDRNVEQDRPKETWVIGFGGRGLHEFIDITSLTTWSQRFGMRICTACTCVG